MIVNIMKDVLITFIRDSDEACDRETPSIYTFTVIVTMTILIVCPIDLIVASMDDADP